MNALDFLRLLYGDNTSGYLALWTKQDRHTGWFPAGNFEAASLQAERLARYRDVYFGVGLQREALDVHHRGIASGVVALPGFWLDVDAQGPAHKAVNLPPTKADARAFLNDFPLSPTLVVDSGHGLQPWWLLRELWSFDSEEERQYAQARSHRFLATLQEKAKARGWQIDPTADLARVLRLPGTWNRKLEPVPVQVIEVNEIRYNPSDFEPYLVEGPLAEDSSHQQWQGPAGALRPVLRACRFLQHCQGDATTLSEPEWWAVVSNVARLEGGQEAIHEISAPYPRYSRAETDQKIAHVLRAAGLHTCRYIQQSLGFTGCPPGGCGVKAPAVLGLSRHDTRTARVLRLRREAEETALRLFAKGRGEAA